MKKALRRMPQGFDFTILYCGKNAVSLHHVRGEGYFASFLAFGFLSLI